MVVETECGDVRLSIANPLGSMGGTGAAAKDVNALVGSERFKEKEAFSAQMAH